MPSTSYSEIKLARRCPKAWEYRYIQNLQRRKPKRLPFIGTILHEMLHAFTCAKLIHTYTNDPWKVLEKYKTEYAKLFRMEKEEYGDIPALAEAIFLGYLRRWRGDGLKYERSEIGIQLDLTGDIRLVAMLDKIVVDKSGRRFLMDHKFKKVLPGPDSRFADIQLLLYFWGWNQTHKKADHLDGVLWDYGRMKPPAIPQLLKDGSLTKRANIDTDVFTYRQAIRDNDLPEKPYSKILKALRGKERTFFDRVYLPAPPKAMVEAVVQDARDTAVIRKALGKAGVSPRNMSDFNCNGCDFRSLCEAEVRGLDAKFVRKRDYTIREHQGDYSNGSEDLEEAA